MQKPLKSGDIICDVGYYKTFVEAKVDTIIEGDGVIYKYRVYTECPTGKQYHLWYQVFIGDERVITQSAHKFMTKSAFRELILEELKKYMKKNLGIS